MRHFSPTAVRRKSALLLSLSSLAVLAACGGGEEEGLNPFSYLSPFAPPCAGADISAYWGVNFSPTIIADTAGLLATTRYLNTNVSIAWLQQNFDSTVPATAIQDPIRTSGAAFAHAAGFTGAGDGDLANLGIYARANGAVAWNNSWGYVGLGPDQAGFDAAFNNGSAESAYYLTSLDEYASEGVVVFSVSNDSLQNATLMDALPFLRPSLEAGWIATDNGVPTMAGGSVTDVHLLSNFCWQAARWCLVADGTWSAATGGGADYAPTTGSSFAAPQVTGALALLAEAFPTLSPHDLRVRLLASAEDDFFTVDDTVELAAGFNKSYSVIYGHGFLDIEAALRPIGGTVMSLAEGGTVSTDAPVLRTGLAFGNAL